MDYQERINETYNRLDFSYTEASKAINEPDVPGIPYEELTGEDKVFTDAALKVWMRQRAEDFVAGLKACGKYSLGDINRLLKEHGYKK